MTEETNLPLDLQTRLVIGDASGEIVKEVECPESMALLQVDNAFCWAVSNTASKNTHYFADGALLEYTEAAKVLKSQKPSLSHIWSNETMSWQDTRSLQDLRDQKWNEIKNARQAAINAPLVTPYGTFDCDPESRSNITNAVALLKTLSEMETPGTVDFTVMDNSTVTLDLAEMTTVALLMGAQIQAAYGTARTRRDAIDAASTIAEVVAIAW